VGFVMEGGRRIPVQAGQNLDYILANGTTPRIQKTLTADRPKSGSLVRRGTLVGSAAISVNGQNIGQIPLTAAQRIEPLPPRVTRHWWWMLLPALVALSLLRQPWKWSAEVPGRRRRMGHG
jgi:hypothetical protein